MPSPSVLAGVALTAVAVGMVWRLGQADSLTEMDQQRARRDEKYRGWDFEVWVVRWKQAFKRRVRTWAAKRRIRKVIQQRVNQSGAAK